VRPLVIALLLVIPPLAQAQSTVYRNVDAEGRVTYSDKPGSGPSSKVPNRVAPEPSAAAYDTAVNRGEIERLYYERQRAGDASRRPVNIYDPRGSATPSMPAPAAPYPYRYRYDPNLPDSPPPSSERRYYYEGR